ncbi:Methyltransferase domain-containing protein [Parasporobacterium paucivorans DSM 15970]|uniref:Methyltransferase domain-containing protein n=1 Tax=Parasporobacterium paucivorans DSM 15970 TaxID=1122934 RepID=A0A1M6H8X4_9FIRM|nr:Methyltransferase domain-containing protein [Parasporobacterium paucivorans DSM 15970]
MEAVRNTKAAAENSYMESYTYLSAVYDIFMDNIPYDAWGKFIVSELKKRGIDDGLILDLGCGTGIMSEILAGAGYDVIGVDSSAEMLAVASAKAAESGNEILYLCQDMREFELYGTVRAVVSVCDALNYILEKEELVRTFFLVSNYLDPGGVFIFDMTTPAEYEEIADDVIAENRDECSFIWENDFDPESSLNRYDLTLFIRDEAGKYDKYDETHVERAYTEEEVRAALIEAGLAYQSSCEDYKNAEPDSLSGRICYIAGECKKEVKE